MRYKKPRGTGQKLHIVRHRPVEGWQPDPNVDGPATDEEVAEAETTDFERMMQEAPLGIDPPGIIRGRRTI